MSTTQQPLRACRSIVGRRHRRRKRRISLAGDRPAREDVPRWRGRVTRPRGGFPVLPSVRLSLAAALVMATLPGCRGCRAEPEWLITAENRSAQPCSVELFLHPDRSAYAKATLAPG